MQAYRRAGSKWKYGKEKKKYRIHTRIHTIILWIPVKS